MPVTDRDFEDPDHNRIIRDRDRDGSGGWGDKCVACGHSRADHIILNPDSGQPVSVLAINSFSNCNITCKQKVSHPDLPEFTKEIIDKCPCERFRHDG